MAEGGGAPPPPPAPPQQPEKNAESEEVCPISHVAFSTLTTPGATLFLACAHRFERDSLVTYLNWGYRVCPLCKHPVSDEWFHDQGMPLPTRQRPPTHDDEADGDGDDASDSEEESDGSIGDLPDFIVADRSVFVDPNAEWKPEHAAEGDDDSGEDDSGEDDANVVEEDDDDDEDDVEKDEDKDVTMAQLDDDQRLRYFYSDRAYDSSNQGDDAAPESEAPPAQEAPPAPAAPIETPSRVTRSRNAPSERTSKR